MEGDEDKEASRNYAVGLIQGLSSDELRAQVSIM
jgi:hypothetical protein